MQWSVDNVVVDTCALLFACQCVTTKMFAFRSPLPPMLVARLGCAAAATEHVIYVCGGHGNGRALAIVERFDISACRSARLYDVHTNLRNFQHIKFMIPENNAIVTSIDIDCVRALERETRCRFSDMPFNRLFPREPHPPQFFFGGGGGAS